MSEAVHQPLADASAQRQAARELPSMSVSIDIKAGDVIDLSADPPARPMVDVTPT